MRYTQRLGQGARLAGWLVGWFVGVGVFGFGWFALINRSTRIVVCIQISLCWCLSVLSVCCVFVCGLVVVVVYIYVTGVYFVYIDDR